MAIHPQLKLFLHLIQMFLIVAAIGLSAPRLFMKNQPRTRANTIALGMGAKSLIIITYQIVTEHVKRFHKWKSLKAYAILNSLEVVFWTAVVFLVIQANIQICVGVGCILSWIVVGLAIVLTLLATVMAIISIRQYRLFRQGGHRTSVSNLNDGRKNTNANDVDIRKSDMVKINHGFSETP